MTFQEWFSEEYPDAELERSYWQVVKSDSKIAWEAAYEEGYKDGKDGKDGIEEVCQNDL